MSSFNGTIGQQSYENGALGNRLKKVVAVAVLAALITGLFGVTSPQRAEASHVELSLERATCVRYDHITSTGSYKYVVGHLFADATNGTSFRLVPVLYRQDLDGQWRPQYWIYDSNVKYWGTTFKAWTYVDPNYRYAIRFYVQYEGTWLTPMWTNVC